MKPFCLFLFLVFSYSLITCKKAAETPAALDIINPDFLDQSVKYQTIATKPSPADSAYGRLQCNTSVSRRTKKSDPDFGLNITGVGAFIINNYNGFSFGYSGVGNTYPYFTFGSMAFPDVPRNFQLNKKYESVTVASRTQPRPIFLGSCDGRNGMTYFVNNVYPPDAGLPANKTYTSIIFTKRTRIFMPERYSDTLLFGSGYITGYCINYYHNTDTTKYVNRWDFKVDFTDLRIDP
jgi:hypothetical protein